MAAQLNTEPQAACNSLVAALEALPSSPRRTPAEQAFVAAVQWTLLALDVPFASHPPSTSLPRPTTRQTRRVASTSSSVAQLASTSTLPTSPEDVTYNHMATIKESVGPLNPLDATMYRYKVARVEAVSAQNDVEILTSDKNLWQLRYNSAMADGKVLALHAEELRSMLAYWRTETSLQSRQFDAIVEPFDNDPCDTSGDSYDSEEEEDDDDDAEAYVAPTPRLSREPFRPTNQLFQPHLPPIFNPFLAATLVKSEVDEDVKPNITEPGVPYWLKSLPAAPVAEEEEDSEEELSLGSRRVVRGIEVEQQTVEERMEHLVRCRKRAEVEEQVEKEAASKGKGKGKAKAPVGRKKRKTA